MAFVQFLLFQKAKPGDEVTLCPEESHHLTKIHRLKKNDATHLLDGEGTVYEAIVLFPHDKKTIVRILSQKTFTRPEPALILAQGLAKADKMELIIQKMTEIGVSRIIPMMSDHSIVNIKDKKEQKKERWQKIADQALKQSGNPFRLLVDDVQSYKDLTLKTDYYKIHFCEKAIGSVSEPLAQVLRKNISNKPILFIIGPEGGYSDQEVQQAIDQEIPLINLGPRILRVETASIVAATLIQYELGQLNSI